MEERLHRLRGTEIFAISEGSGMPVICMHGITANGYVSEPIVKELASEFLMVSIDERGHGRSGRPQSYEDEDFAEDALDLIRDLGKGPAILVGHSLGARNGIVAGVKAPELVAGVVAIEFTPFIETEVLDQLESRVNGGDRVYRDMDDIRSYLSGRYPLLPPAAIERRAVHGYRPLGDGTFRPLADPRGMGLTAAGLRKDLEAPLRALTRPTVLVRGEISKLVSVDAWAKTLKLRPDLPAETVAKADHYVPEEEPGITARIIRDFAKTLPKTPR